VVLSSDGGATFSTLTMPGTDTDWRAIAMSADATRMAAATGRFVASTVGQLYTSQGGRTSTGTGGAIVGNQNAGVTLKYLGNGAWSVQASSGGPFTIR
jgi:hypothetical protein